MLIKNIYIFKSNIIAIVQIYFNTIAMKNLFALLAVHRVTVLRVTTH